VREPVDYIAIGPVFGTASKATGYDAVGIAMVEEAATRAHAHGLQVVAIGGITLERAADVIRAGADSVRIISDLFEARAIARACARVPRPIGRLSQGIIHRMSSPLFATKSLKQLHEEMAGENRLRRVLGPIQLTSLGVGAIIGAGFLSRPARPPTNVGRTLAHAFVRGGGRDVCFCRALLCRVLHRWSRGRFRLHVRVRHARRAVRMDHRLGSHPRVRR